VKGYDYFLFDWDGCLAKTLEVWLGAYKQSLAVYGVQPSDTEISNHFGDWELPRYFGIDEYAKCNTAAVEIARQNLKKVELYEGARGLLSRLKDRGSKMALLSSSSKDVLLKGVRHNNLENYFEAILSGDDVSKHKPDPEVIDKGLAALAGVKSRAVMIGDSRKDLEAAKNAGIDSVLIYPGSHKIFYDLEDLKQHDPTYTFNSLEEVAECLQ
jgi:pyrophosphatase PpaX